MTPRLRILLLALVPILVVTAACGSDSGGSSEKSGKSAAKGECTYIPDGRKPARAVKTPPSTPTTKKPTTVTISTNRGDIKATLSADKTPCTVNSFLSLAKQGFFDETKCHRIHLQDYFVLQCGDPSGTGGEGPGYAFDDELTGQESYTAGTLAMANGGPNTNGSQFFIVFAKSAFPPSYTVFGTIDASGLQLVQKIAKEGIGVPNTDPALGPGDGSPKNPVIIKSVK